MARQYDHRGRDQVNIENVQGNVILPGEQRPARSRTELILLKAVADEVTSRLAQSLHQAVLINLEKQVQPEQVKRPWDAEIKIGAKPSKPLPPEIKILDVFVQSDIKGKLLILGKPGSGKTTTMLELAQVLIRTAEDNLTDPMPVLFNLSTWKTPRQEMKDWLAAELKSKYGVRKEVGNQWIKEKQLLPLLDGLDEVKPEHQESCVEAINQLLQSDCRPIYLVVCSRREEYENYQTRLQLNGAILLNDLTDAQIQDYLRRVNCVELWQELEADEALLEVVRKPLLLSITMLSYTTLFLEQWRRATSTEVRLQLLLDAYVQRMLSREFESRAYRNQKPPTARQTRQWLIFLAQQLQKELQTEFLIEKMQPSWLKTDEQKAAYIAIAPQMIGLSIWLFVAMGIFLPLLITINVEGFIAGLIFAAFCGWIGSLISEVRSEIVPVEALEWSLIPAAKKLLAGLDTGIRLGFLVGILAMLFTNCESLASILFLGVCVGLVLGLVIGIADGLTGLFYGVVEPDKSKKIYPNQGIWRSALNAVVTGVFFVVFLSLIGSLIDLLAFRKLFVFAYLGLCVGEVFALFFSMSFGGQVCIRHLALRFVLCRNKLIPWNYARFLNYATERMFLQRVGGRYWFIHKLLQEHFAEMRE